MNWFRSAVVVLVGDGRNGRAFKAAADVVQKSSDVRGKRGSRNGNGDHDQEEQQPVFRETGALLPTSQQAKETKG